MVVAKEKYLEHKTDFCLVDRMVDWRGNLSVVY
jgi:hypothetical protein